ncbi:60S ribosomal protein L6 [Ancistrocladus abbreviatus]
MRPTSSGIISRQNTAIRWITLGSREHWIAIAGEKGFRSSADAHSLLMAASVTPSFHTSNLKSVFLGEKSGINVSNVPITRVGFLRTTVECKESRIGKQPISVPSNVAITLEGQDLKVKGPLGELSITYPREVKVEKEEAGSLRVRKALETRRANQMHGLFRTLTDNMVVGVSKGFEKKLQLVGVGYRAVLEGKDLVLSLGFSHPVRMTIPDDLKVKVEENTRVTVSGYDKSAIGQFAASIRRWRPPEPYKGKGVRYVDEVVRLKEGKAGKKK